MARYLKPRFKLYYREKINLYLKNRFFDKKKLKSKPKDLKNSDILPSYYYFQFKERQKLKIIYGVLNKQFNSYFYKSKKLGGNLAENILILLETRLDNVVYRMGVGATRAESRQIVSHGCILVNNVNCNIPSKLLKVLDIVKLKNKCINHFRVINSFNLYKNMILPSWIFINFNEFSCYLKRLPLRKDLDINVNENLVLDSYYK